uniref:Uncharacterized protein n=1 Tax=Mucochytrium quahogii TaxID=96639 RepID=A0A7S2WLA2_9STRA|mmetsp:Transcript_7213/g.11500  ORF Transcript_7213/g.11500 Transcript_7213/m.11500 type:complete len:673 (+) Transcript_7213:431-2449(+)
MMERQGSDQVLSLEFLDSYAFGEEAQEYDDTRFEEGQANMEKDIFQQSMFDDMVSFMPENGQRQAAQRKLTFEQVFDLLDAANSGRLPANMPVRNQASPISVLTRCFFVVPSVSGLVTTAQKMEQLGDPSSLIGVKYQSFSNAEVWWSEKTKFTRGLVARNMSRKVRSYKPGPSEDHGYAGRWFSLVVRDDPSQVVVRANCRSFVQMQAPSLVQFWELDDEMKKRSNKKRRKMSDDSSTASSVQTSHFHDALDTVSPSAKCVISEIQHKKVQQPQIMSVGGPQDQDGSPIKCLKNPETGEGVVVIQGGLNVQGNATFYGDLTVRNLHVRGSLTVEQGMSGQLVTPPDAADYAEWFEKLDPKEDISSGDIVQLRSPEQKITKSTDGKGPILVVSTTPSVAAGVPFAKKEMGLLCGFLGQVPVKCRGPIQCGQLLVPSGNNDGLAIVGKVHHSAYVNPIGTAMEACGEGTHTILSFVRWAHDPEWQGNRETEKSAQASIATIWQNTNVVTAIAFFKMLLLFSNVYTPMFLPLYLQIAYVFDVFGGVWALLHSPRYIEFVFEINWFYLMAVCKILAAIVSLLDMFIFSEGAKSGETLTRIAIAKLLFDTCFLVSEIYAGKMEITAFRRVQVSVLAKYGNPTLEEYAKMSQGDSTFEMRKKALKEFIFGTGKEKNV